MFEIKLEERWYEAIALRRSVRKFDAPPTDDQLLRIGSLARQLSWQGIRIPLLQGPGLKGTIKGTDVYAVIVAAKDTMREQEGYAGEAIALESASMGLGSCWLGAGFYKGVVRKAAKLKDGEDVHCVIAIGRYDAGAPVKRKRKPLQVTSGLTREQLQALPEWQRLALECAAAAPSALNLQPWRFQAAQGAVQVLGRGLSLSYAPLDRGIAMLHAAIGAARGGVSGTWRNIGEGWEFKAR